MPCDSNKRSERRYNQRILDSYRNTLETVTINGNTASQGAHFNDDLEVSGYVRGDGSQLTNLPYIVGPLSLTLDDVVTVGNTAQQGVYFQGDLEATGKIIGNGSDITNLPSYIVTPPSFTLDDAVTNGNVSTIGAKFTGDLEAVGYVRGDGSQLTNLPYIVGPLSLTLDDVVISGNLALLGAKFTGDLEATGYVRGDGSQLTNLPYITGLTNLTLDDVVISGNTASRGAKFTGDLEATGYVKGDGTYLTNLPYITGPTNLTLDDVVISGNLALLGAKFTGDLEATGYVKGNGSLLTGIPIPNLQSVILSGNTASLGAKFTGDLEATGYVKGNGSLLSGLPTPNLQSVVLSGNTASRGAYFQGDLEATGYVKGNGSLLTGLPTPNLQSVVLSGNTASRGAYFQGDLEATGYVKGNGSLLTGLPIPNLQSVGSSTNRTVYLQNTVTSLQASGNVRVGNRLTCSYTNGLRGNGEFLSGVANVYNLSVLSSTITNTENKKIITNTSSLTNVSQGDILISTSNGTLGKLPIGTNGKVLYSNPTTLQPEWKTFTDIFNVSSRTSALESKILFTGTPNLSSLTTGDILYGYANNDIRRLARQTTVSGTFLTTGDYGTGYGRLLRMDEHGENVMWLHPSNYNTNSGNTPIFTTGTSPINYITIELRTDRKTKCPTAINNTPLRIPIRDAAPANDLLFSVRFNDSAFYSEAGKEYSYSGYGNTKHPTGIKWKLYTYGSITAGTFFGDGSKMVFPANPALPLVPTVGQSGAPSLGKAGQILVFSDKRRKTNIKKISNALDTLSRMIPRLYDKEGKRESGFIAQEVYYDVHEMRHIVWPDRDASPNDDAPEPDYSDWGKRMACIRYFEILPYVIKSIQELRVRIEKIKNNKD